MADQPPAQAAEPIIREWLILPATEDEWHHAGEEHNAAIRWLLRQKDAAERERDEERANADREANHAESMARKADALETALTASRAQARALREALRTRVVIIPVPGDGFATCAACAGIWEPGGPEVHRDGCLAAPSKERE